MLNTVFFISDNWEELLRAQTSEEHTTIIFLVNKTNNDLKELVHLVYCAQKKVRLTHRISLCFDTEYWSGSPALQRHAEEYLCNLAFHPSFYVVHNHPVLFFQRSADHAGATDVLNEVKELLSAQSFDDAQILEVKQAELKDMDRTYVFELMEESMLPLLGEFYVNTFLNKGICNQPVMIRSGRVSLLKAVERELKAAEIRFQKSNGMAYDHMKALVCLTTQNETLKYQLRVRNDLLQSCQQSLQLMKSQDEANRINEFYYFEYEILPLWYKRVGHLIKALRGQRSFRSLIDSNNKKYRDQFGNKREEPRTSS